MQRFPVVRQTPPTLVEATAGTINLTRFEDILALAITLALLQAIEFTEVRFSD